MIADNNLWTLTSILSLCITIIYLLDWFESSLIEEGGLLLFNFLVSIFLLPFFLKEKGFTDGLSKTFYTVCAYNFIGLFLALIIFIFVSITKWIIRLIRWIIRRINTNRIARSKRRIKQELTSRIIVEENNKKIKQDLTNNILFSSKVLCIFDTSDLMINKTNHIVPSLYINEEAFKMSISYNIPTQVIRELSNHFKDSEKEIKARSGRKKINILKRDFGAEEVDISGVEPYKSSSVIGSDSLVDRQIVGYALKMLEGDYQFVVIATEDGGIQYDIIELRKSGYKIYSSDEEEQLKSDIRLYVEKELGERK